LRVLREAALVAAEDTRRTRTLLNHYGIRSRLASYHGHNRQKKIPVLIDTLLDGLDVALVSDAGTPGISDPGEELVRAAVANQITVVSLPGPSALTCALAGSGLPSAPFAFFGFPPARGRTRSELLDRMMAEDKTVIFYEAPHRLARTLGELADRDPGRPAVVARELTKLHEEFARGTLQELNEKYPAGEVRGECTVLLAPAPSPPLSGLKAEELVGELLAGGMSTREAVREAAARLGVSRRELYQRFCVKK
jgi:16S rRNA (cytidine1402-2'-O)-methyltransferase